MTTFVKPATMKHAVYRDDGKWYWTQPGFSRPVGPFDRREDARNDFRYCMGIDKIHRK